MTRSFISSATPDPGEQGAGLLAHFLDLAEHSRLDLGPGNTP